MCTEREGLDEGRLNNHLPQHALFLDYPWCWQSLTLIVPSTLPASFQGSREINFRHPLDKPQTEWYLIWENLLFVFFFFILFFLLLEGKKIHSHSISRGKWENPAEQIGALQRVPLKSLSAEITFPFKAVQEVPSCLTCFDVNFFIRFLSFRIHLGARGACVFPHPLNQPRVALDTCPRAMPAAMWTLDGIENVPSNPKRLRMAVGELRNSVKAINEKLIHTHLKYISVKLKTSECTIIFQFLNVSPRTFLGFGV